MKTTKKRFESKSGKGTFTRREFIATAGLGTGALLSPLSLASNPSFQTLSSSDRPAAAVIGLGNRGNGMALWQMPPFADVVAVCDVDRRRSRSVSGDFYRKTGRKIEVYEDYRRILDRQDIQIICNATPEHWHTKINVEACLAGKDLYAEKPLTLTVEEGKILQRVVQQTGRIVQVGTQQRSGIQFQMVCNLVGNGGIGKLKQIAVYLPGSKLEHGGACSKTPVPGELNWDMWSGQAPLNPYCEARFNRPNNWWDYGGGPVTNWGEHHMDIAQWGMGKREIYPLSVEAEGYGPNIGKDGYPDQFRPFAALLEYPDDIELWFLSIPPDPAENPRYEKVIERVYKKVPDAIRNYNVSDKEGGVLFIGDKGKIFVGRAGTSAEGISELDRIPLPDDNGYKRWISCLYHHTHNFMDCIKARRQPASSVAEHHPTQLACHLVNIALRAGRKLRWDAGREEFIGDSEANNFLSRQQRDPYSIQG